MEKVGQWLGTGNYSASSAARHHLSGTTGPCEWHAAVLTQLILMTLSRCFGDSHNSGFTSSRRVRLLAPIFSSARTPASSPVLASGVWCSQICFLPAALLLYAIAPFRLRPWFSSPSGVNSSLRRVFFSLPARRCSQLCLKKWQSRRQGMQVNNKTSSIWKTKVW